MKDRDALVVTPPV